MISDESLMLQFQAGSHESFEELFARYQDPLYGFFRRRLQGDGAAEDLAQETWLVVLKKSVRYEPRAQFRSYLYSVAFRLMLSERRKHARNEPSARPDSIAVPASADAGLLIRQALSKLENVEREILMLREYEQLSYAEIAELLKIPINTVRSRLFRARLATRQLLEPSAEPAATQRRQS